MSPEEQCDWLALILVPHLGPIKIQRLREKLGCPTQIISCPDNMLRQAGLSAQQIGSLRKPDEKRLDTAFSWLHENPAHHLISITDSNYPELLKTTEAPPQLLFAKGDISLLRSLQLSIVGSRNPTQGGRETAFEFARYLASAGLAITSGLAFGIDAASHEGALDAGGHTIAVTGNGLDRIYPAQHHKLARQIVEQGLLLSEYLPGTRPLPQNFPRRNRIISGLSLGTLVVEAGQKSGSLITAYKALEQSREVFAIPGSIHNPLARGCHQLIKEGAKLVESAHDIFEELGPLAQASLQLTPHNDTRAEENTVDHTSPEHDHVLEIMGFDPVSFDTLIERTKMTSSALSSVLLILELENKISLEASGHYVRSTPA